MFPLRHASNEITSGVLHLVGAVLAIAILVILVVFAALKGTSVHVTTFTIYGVGMVLLYVISAIYHLFPYSFHIAKGRLQKIDHTMIYIFIAATYTPASLLLLPEGKGILLLVAVWILASIGAFLTLGLYTPPKYVPVLLYLSMGWGIVIFVEEVLKNTTTTEFVLLLSGGIAYTIGVIFFALESRLPPRKYFWMHEIFHIFVIAGSTLHTILMFFLLS